MTEFEKVLQECLHNLEQGASSVDDCLRRHPNHASQLEPVLLTSMYLQRGGEARVSDAFKMRVRTKLIQQMNAHPRRPAQRGFTLVRLATGLAVGLLALLATGTVYAQSALPGSLFYAWKLASEHALRAVSPDPVRTDLMLAERRMDELIAVREDPTLSAQALGAYLEAAERLRAEADAENEVRILAVLDSQMEELNQSGIVLPGTDPEIPPPSEAPTLPPAAIPTATPLPILETPRVVPTDLPQILPTIEAPVEAIPTIQDPPNIIPTIQDLPNTIPTIEIPPLLP